MSNAISKIKIKLLNKNFRAVLYLIYFIFLYIIARFIALHIQLYNFEFVSDLHKSLIEIEVNILEMYFNYLDLLKYVKENTLVFTNDNSIIVLSGCSGLDPMFRILFIVLCFPGPIRSKIWYIPFSLLLVLLAAIIHLIILSYVIIYLPEYYGLAHNYITRIVFYGMYFLIWVYWLEKFVLKKKKKDVVVKG